MGNKVSLEDEMINLRIVSKQMTRAAKKSEKNEKAALEKTKKVRVCVCVHLHSAKRNLILFLACGNLSPFGIVIAVVVLKTELSEPKLTNFFLLRNVVALFFFCVFFSINVPVHFAIQKKGNSTRES